jgi:Ferritin-like domain
MSEAHDEQLELARLLAEVDVDGALAETADAAFPASRGDFFRTAVAGGTAALAALALPRSASGGAAKTKNDIRILRFDLVLEYLQSGLYTEAERIGALRPKTLGWARVVGAHERAHAQAIKNLLGRKAVPSPSFNFGDVTEKESSFIKTAVAFEELTAALLKWQAERIDSREIVAAAATLHSVETRHAAWIRRIIGLTPAASAFDQPAAQRRMARLIASTHFVARRPKTARRRRPRFTG